MERKHHPHSQREVPWLMISSLKEKGGKQLCMGTDVIQSQAAADATESPGCRASLTCQLQRVRGRRPRAEGRADSESNNTETSLSTER